jgi:putative adhesin
MATFVRTQTIAHPIGERGRLVLRVTAADVQMTARPGDEANVRATFEIRASSDEEADRIFDGAKLHVDAEAGQLAVEEQDGAGNLGAAISQLFGGRRHVNLSVAAEVPPGAELRLEGVSADVRAQGLRGDQHYATTSGDLYLTDLGGAVRVSTVSGDVTIRAGEPLEVHVDAVSGDLSVITPRLDGLRANTVSGDLEIEGALGGGEFRVDTVSGDLTVGLLGGASFEVRGVSTDIRSDLDHRIEGQRDRRRVVVGGGGPAFSFNSMSGDLDIRRPRRLEGRDAPPPTSQPAPARPAGSQPTAEEQLAVLRALEAGEIDVDEATRRLGGVSDA